MADYRLPIYLQLPIKVKVIICEPLLEKIDFSAYLTPEINFVTTDGESGIGARACYYDWVIDLWEQCVKANVSFYYHQTGAKLVKDGRTYRIPKDKQNEQATRAGIDFAADRSKQ